MIYAIVENEAIVNIAESEEALDVNWFPMLENGNIGNDFVNGHVVSQGEAIITSKTAQLLNFIIKSDNVVVDSANNIHSIKAKLPFAITADVNDKNDALAQLLTARNTPKAKLTVMAERVRGGNALDVIDDVRFDMLIDATSLAIDSTSGFEISGNYVVTQERMNKALKAIGLPFEIEMPMLEFDVVNA
ncbi:hypothetical protein [Cognaticolwellia mytili]|uniref:hypothetical protein n=1 Tax=Cognaticolwellia mytili TaxID=1888913 RepID=UPI000A16DB4E|nr:hypothetical protein [Cognaticolwellia mytili]